MKKSASTICMLLVCLLLLAGCDLAAMGLGTATPDPTVNPAAAPTTAAPTAAPPTEEPTPEPTATPTPEPTVQSPLPSEAYTYFGRVGFGGGVDGSPETVRWTEQISIQVTGKPNAGDRKALYDLVASLRTIAHLPEIVFVTEGGNFVIGFVPKSQGKGVLSEYGGDDAEGAVQWNGGVASVRVVIADELTDQNRRSGSLAFFFMRGLGLAEDSDGEHGDSALNRSGTAVAPSQLDMLMLRLLYSNLVKPGMGREEALAAVLAFDPEQPNSAPGSAGGPSVSKRDVLDYFNEVGFYWASGANEGVVSKWSAPVKLQVSGSPTDAQKALLDMYIEGIGAFNGFPGFEAVTSGGTLVINYGTAADLKKENPKMTAAEAGYILINRNEKTGKITGCQIAIANDYPDEAVGRNQFLRLLMKALGFAHTSLAWTDSIFHNASSTQDWSALDWKMVETLYRADVKAGEKRAAVMKRLLAE